MSEKLEPLSSDLRALLDAERAAPPPIPPDAIERAVAVVRAAGSAAPPSSQGSGASPGAHAPSALGKAALISKKLAAVLAVASAGAGFAGGVAFERARVPEPEPRAAMAAAPLAPEAALPAVDAALPAIEPAIAAPPAEPAKIATRAIRPAAAVQDEPEPSAQNERQLIDAAREALRRGRAHDALVFLMNHERRFSNGALREEREFLAIESLLAEGRRDRAFERAAQFERDFPTSAYRAQLRERLR